MWEIDYRGQQECGKTPQVIPVSPGHTALDVSLMWLQHYLLAAHSLATLNHSLLNHVSYLTQTQDSATLLLLQQGTPRQVPAAGDQSTPSQTIYTYGNTVMQASGAGGLQSKAPHPPQKYHQGTGIF